ncbi:ZIP family metal transporter [Natroniella acetigena]|uniref:ZIP family metal transporter n=1 Tax=Natroniella acetigena TaxID=52004 RepID=UPI00200AF359|nr:ZIP family metal transporter [Natroniella acetigena]MCK8828116.1 ZIP family metal transporter [Natroniella acetigena]
MEQILMTTVIGLIAGMLGTGLGGASIILWRKPDDKSVSLLLGLTGGMMLSIVLVDLIPASIEHGSFVAAVAGVFLGLIALDLTAYYFKSEKMDDWYIQTGILLGIGISLHNFPEGLAIGAGYLVTTELGFGLAVLMALHNFPEGLSMATALKAGGWSSPKILLATILPGIPMGLGALTGSLIGYISPVVLAITLGFAGGAMLYITTFELIPSAYNFRYTKVQATIGVILGLVAGVLITILV